MGKITRTTIKKFIKDNFDKLYIKQLSIFDGMVDCVMPKKDASFKKVFPDEKNMEDTLGVSGAWFVGESRDDFTLYSDDFMEGYKISNCCGSFVLAIPKDSSSELKLLESLGLNKNAKQSVSDLGNFDPYTCQFCGGKKLNKNEYWYCPKCCPIPWETIEEAIDNMTTEITTLQEKADKKELSRYGFGKLDALRDSLKVIYLLLEKHSETKEKIVFTSDNKKTENPWINCEVKYPDENGFFYALYKNNRKDVLYYNGGWFRDETEEVEKFPAYWRVIE
jgi:hypothetical protein